MHGSQSGYKHSKLSLSNYHYKEYSPTSTNHRPSPKLLEKLYSPKASKMSKNMSPDISEFIIHLQGQLKRISSTFSFNFFAEPPLRQASEFVTQAVDFYLNEKEKLSENFKRKHEYSSEKEFFTPPKDSIESEKAKEITKNLTRFEQLLKKKEEKLEEEKKIVIEDRIRLSEWEEDLKQAAEKFSAKEKAWAETKTAESQQIKAERAEADKRINEAKDLKERVERKIDETTKRLRYEKEGLLTLENCINKTKQNLIEDQKKVLQDKLELEKEKWNLEQRERKIEEGEILIEMKTERFEQEKLEFEAEKNKILEMKFCIEDKKFDYPKEKKYDVKSSNFKLSEDFQNFEKFVPGRSENDLKSRELDQREDEIEEAYKELQNQMDKFNKELEEREFVLEEKEISFAKTEKELVWKLENLKKIEASLVESQSQAEELRTSTIPGLETQSENMESLIKQLVKKKNELETVLIKLNKEIEVVLEYKNICTKDSNSFALDESKSSDTLEQITKDLESKMLSILEREKELDLAQEKLENEKAKIIETAEFLKKAHLDVEQMRIDNGKEILQEKEKLKAQFYKIEAGMKLISTKEAEILSYRKELEEKEMMLRIKENDFLNKTKEE